MPGFMRLSVWLNDCSGAAAQQVKADALLQTSAASPVCDHHLCVFVGDEGPAKITRPCQTSHGDGRRSRGGGLNLCGELHGHVILRLFSADDESMSRREQR